MSDLLLLGIAVLVVAGLYILLSGSNSKKDDDAKSQAWRGSGAQNIDPLLRNSTDTVYNS